MDTSETYIKMCKKAKKSLPKHKWQNGDYGFYDGRVVVFCEECHTFQSDIFDGTWIPLFHQDQLQEISLPQKDNACLVILISNFSRWVDKQEWPLMETSMEQLWLSYVMSQRRKSWNGEDWVGQ